MCVLVSSLANHTAIVNHSVPSSIKFPSVPLALVTKTPVENGSLWLPLLTHSRTTGIKLTIGLYGRNNKHLVLYIFKHCSSTV